MDNQQFQQTNINQPSSPIGPIKRGGIKFGLSIAIVVICLVATAVAVYWIKTEPVEQNLVNVSVPKTNKSNVSDNLSGEGIIEQIEFQNVIAYIKVSKNWNYIIIKTAEGEREIANAPIDFEKYMNESKRFSGLTFSPSGRYLIYDITGWEWTGGYVYDLTEEKIVLNATIGAIGFVDNEKFFYACQTPGMGTTGHASIYKTPDFKLIYTADVSKWQQIHCEIKDSDTLRITMSDDARTKFRIIDYSFSTGRENIIQ